MMLDICFGTLMWFVYSYVFQITEFCLLNGQQGGFQRENIAGSSYPHSVLFRDTSFFYQPDAVDSARHSGDENTIPSDASLSVLKQGITRNTLFDCTTLHFSLILLVKQFNRRRYFCKILHRNCWHI